MPFPVPDLQPEPFRDPPAIVQNLKREDVLWNRPVFQAPPLVLDPPPFGRYAPKPDLNRGRPARN